MANLHTANVDVFIYSTGGGGTIYHGEDLGDSICGNGAITAGGTKYYYPVGLATAAASDALSNEWVAPRAGYVQNLWAQLDTAPTSTYSITTTVRTGVLGTMADSTVVSVISAAATAGQDQTHQVYVPAGGLVSVKVVSSNASAASGFVSWGFQFTPASNPNE